MARDGVIDWRKARRDGWHRFGRTQNITRDMMQRLRCSYGDVTQLHFVIAVCLRGYEDDGMVWYEPNQLSDETPRCRDDDSMHPNMVLKWLCPCPSYHRFLAWKVIEPIDFENIMMMDKRCDFE